MRDRNLRRCFLIVAACLGLGPTMAFASGSNNGPIPGDAEVLLNPATDPLVKVLVNKPNANGVSTPDHVAQPAGAISGWNIKDIRLRYLNDSGQDTMLVGVNSFGIVGDVDGNGSPSVASPATLAVGGIKYANLGGRESVTVAFDTNRDGKPDVVAGVPAILPNPLDPMSKMDVPGSGLNGFLVSKYTSGPIQYAYGTRLADNQGQLLYDPSATNPDFIFTIKNWSKLPGLTDPYSFGLQMYAGSPDDVVAGEDSYAAALVKVPQPENVVPEPATCLVWGLAAALAAARALRLRKTARD